MSTQQESVKTKPGEDSVTLRVYVIAGEASGDALGGAIMRALKERAGPQLQFVFAGIGGAAMEKEGLRSLFPMHELSLMGIAEIFPKLRSILKRIRQATENIVEFDPDIILTIDSPDFCFRVLRRVSKAGFARRAGEKPVGPAEHPAEHPAERSEKLSTKIPTGLATGLPRRIHCVAPSVWAWRPGRAKKIAAFLDGLLCLLPFEPPYFAPHGLDAAFIGHPMLEKIPDGPQAQAQAAAKFRVRHHIPQNAFVLAILPGSRKGEIKRAGASLFQAVSRIATSQAVRDGERPLHLLIPTVPHLHARVERDIAQHFRQVDGASAISRERIVITQDPVEKWAGFAACDAALAVSGTAALELAVSGVPHVIAYKMNPVTWALVRLLVRVRHAHLVNIMLRRAVVPECLQSACAPDKIASALAPLLDENSAIATAQRQAFQQVREMLAAPQGRAPSRAAADYILTLAGRGEKMSQAQAALLPEDLRLRDEGEPESALLRSSIGT